MNFLTKCAVLAVYLITVTSVALASGVVTCYFGSWSAYRKDKGKFVVEDIDPYLCTHLIYSFIGVNSDGTIRILDSGLDVDSKGFKRFTALKKKNSKLKTLVAIGGGSEKSDTFSTVVSNSNLRGKLVKNAINFITTYGFDGLDLDWEYPAQNGGKPEDKKNFVELIKKMRREFDKHGFLLTAAVAAYSHSVDISYDVPALSKHLHYINVMTYDLHGVWNRKTGENAPLYASSHDVSPVEKQLNVKSCIQGWLNRGANPQKIVLGLATYGRSFRLVSSNKHGIGAPISGEGDPGPYSQSAGTLMYNEICKYLRRGQWTKVWNEKQKVPYMYKGNQWVGYDDSQSIKLKVDFAKRLKLGGVMVWSIDSDDFRGECGSKNPLLNTIKKAF